MVFMVSKTRQEWESYQSSFAASGGATGTDDAHKGTWVSFDDAESARNQFQASGLGLKIPKGFFLLDIDHKDISDPFAQLMLSR